MNKLWKKILGKLLAAVIIFIIFIYSTAFICSIPMGLDFVQTDKGLKLNAPISWIIASANKVIISIMHGNFGSLTASRPVKAVIMEYFMRSIWLLVGAIILGSIIGILKGIFDSKRGKRRDSSLKVLSSVISISLPEALSIALLQALVIWLSKHGITIFKVAGSDGIKSIWMPIIALSILPAGYAARITAMAIENCYEKDYIKAALGKGCSNKRILWNHVMRNAIGLIMESFSNITAIIICNLMIVEYMFAYAGLTMLLLKALKDNIMDKNVIITVTIIVFGFIYFITGWIFKLIKALTNIKMRGDSI